MYQKFKSNFSNLNIKKNVELLRTSLRENNLEGFIIPQSDQFQGEFLNFNDLRLEWISGFSGSAGLAIILKTKAAIFVDGRYETQLNFEIDKRIFEPLSLSYLNLGNWINEKIKSKNTKIGFDPWLFSISQFQEIRKSLKNNISLIATKNLVDDVWIKGKEKTKKIFWINHKQ